MPYEVKPVSWAKIPPKRIIAWIERNFDFKTRKNGEEYQVCDPFSGDTGYKFGINPENGLCHSWLGDIWAGPVNPETGKRNCSFLKFVKVYRQCSYTEALQDIMGGEVSLSDFIRPKTVGPKIINQIDLPPGAQKLAGATKQAAEMSRRWLLGRGYTEEAMARYDLHYCGMDVIWPYFEWSEIVYWQARSSLNKRFLFPDTDVYENGKLVAKQELNKGDFLYGFDEVEQASYVVITEAIFGQYTLGAQALASGGASLTPKQVAKIKLLGPRKGIILSPDNDEAGLKSIVENAKLLTPLGFPLYYSTPPKLEYLDDDDNKKHTKDWNELLTGCKKSQQAIRQIHDERIRRYGQHDRLELMKKIRGLAHA